MEQAKHSVLTPSSADCWGRPDGCPAYVQAGILYPETEQSESALEGEATHWVGENVLSSYGPYADQIISPRDMLNTVSPNGVIVTEEMTDAAEVYARDVLRVCQEHGLLKHLRVERPVKVERVHPECWGTPDAAAIMDFVHNTLHIWDLKYGYKLVEVYECWQLITYAIGLLDEVTGGNGMLDQDMRVEFHIVQPRPYSPEGPCRTWNFPASDLRGYANVLNANAALALGPNPPTRTGEQCHYCPAKHDCPANLAAGHNAIDVSGMLTPVNMSGTALGIEMAALERAAKTIKYRMAGLEAKAESMLRGGTVVPGWDLKPNKGRLKWNKPPAEVIMLGEMLGTEVRKLDALLTPTQAIAAGLDEAVILGYSQRTSGLKLGQDTTNKAAKVFRS